MLNHQRQQVVLGRILPPGPAWARRMDFCNALLNKLPLPQAVEKQMAQFTVYRLESPGIISVSLYCCLEVTTERVLRVGGRLQKMFPFNNTEKLFEFLPKCLTVEGNPHFKRR